MLDEEVQKVLRAAGAEIFAARAVVDEAWESLTQILRARSPLSEKLAARMHYEEALIAFVKVESQANGILANARKGAR